MKQVSKNQLLIFLIILNVLGTLFGFYYYLDQLQASPIHLWIFIPVSPLATLFFASSIYLHLKEKGSGLLDALAFLGNFKYGLWTVFVLIYYSDIFFAGNTLFLYGFMFLSHLGMAIQSFTVFYWGKIGQRELIFGGLWFLLNDLVDYSLGTHTNIYTENVLPAEITAYTLTFVGLLTGYILIEKAPRLIGKYGLGKIQNRRQSTVQ